MRGCQLRRMCRAKVNITRSALSCRRPRTGSVQASTFELPV